MTLEVFDAHPVPAAELSSAEARALTDDIKHHVEQAWAKLRRAHDGRAWKALGYSGWGAYVAEEFRISRQHSYKLINHARLVEELDVSHACDTMPPVRETADLTYDERRQVVEEVAAGKPPAEAVRDVKAQREPEPELAPIVTIGDVEVIPPKPHVSHNSGENEWYTPAPYIEAARKTMGSIDLDPATSQTANRTVQAANIYTAETNGLAHPWGGNIWLNPPYAQPLIAQFATKLADEYEAGNTRQACVLVNNATETVWFRTLADTCAAICFPTGRIRFIDPAGNPSGAPLQGQAILYFGPHPGTFEAAFAQFGFVVYR